MLKYIITRLIYMFITLWVIITATFFLMYTLPGDPVQTGLKLLPAAQAQNLRVKWGLDKPITEQYIVYMGKLLHGDLGESMKTYGLTANQIIGQTFPHSARLGGQAMVVGVVIGVALGILSAFKRGRLPDQVIMFIAIIGVSIPSFVLASLLQATLGGWILPIIGWPQPGQSFLTGLSFTILPTIAASFGSIAVYSRYTRSSTLDVLSSEHILTARAKGLSEGAIFQRHVFRNSLTPLVTIFAPQLSGIVTGSFVLETIFGIPGLGKYYITCISNRDFPMIMATTIFFSTLFVASIVLMDILYVLIDPRVRLTKSRNE